MQPTGARTYALLGSGEFEPWAEEADRWCLDRSRPGRVLILPTASAPEGDEVFDRWGRMGLEHYARMGVLAEVVPLRTREDAARREVCAALEGAAMVFFSGGNPGYLAETLEGTAFWGGVVRGLDRGLAYGGCSAGIAVLGQRAAWRLNRRIFRTALGVFPQTNLAPHWDAVDRFVPGMREYLSSELGATERLVAVDERTAMVGDGNGWSVFGAGSVHVLSQGSLDVYRRGVSFDLDLAKQPTGQ
jgi:cyanophycinase